MTEVFNAQRRRFVRLSPEDYLKKREQDPASIRRAIIVPPSLANDHDYGAFLVEVTQPIYEVDI